MVLVLYDTCGVIATSRVLIFTSRFSGGRESVTAANTWGVCAYVIQVVLHGGWGINRS